MPTASGLRQRRASVIDSLVFPPPCSAIDSLGSGPERADDHVAAPVNAPNNRARSGCARDDSGGAGDKEGALEGLWAQVVRAEVAQKPDLAEVDGSAAAGQHAGSAGEPAYSAHAVIGGVGGKGKRSEERRVGKEWRARGGP